MGMKSLNMVWRKVRRTDCSMGPGAAEPSEKQGDQSQLKLLHETPRAATTAVWGSSAVLEVPVLRAGGGAARDR
jgi:hypothetical protein